MLYRLNPELARQFEDLKSFINAPSEGREDLSKVSLFKEHAVSKLHDLVAHIRTNIGFEDFPDLPPKVKLLENPSDQVTVLLNTTWFRTDALLIHSNKRIQILPLNKSVFQDSKDYYKRICDRFGYNNHGDWRKSNEDMRVFFDMVMGSIS